MHHHLNHAHLLSQTSYKPTYLLQHPKTLHLWTLPINERGCKGRELGEQGMRRVVATNRICAQATLDAALGLATALPLAASKAFTCQGGSGQRADENHQQ
jgi:hypothetical protein